MYRGGFIDYHLMDIFKRLQVLGEDRVVYLKDTVIEHLHYRYGKSEVDATYQARGPLDVGDEVFINLRKYRQTAAGRLASGIHATSPPELPRVKPAAPLPDNDCQAIAGFAGKLLLDGLILIPWRAHLFEVLSRCYLLKKYKYPEPTWQYRLLKTLALLLKPPFQLIQKFK